jgi:type IX secretion system PorP/SprF family membrane protein
MNKIIFIAAISTLFCCKSIAQQLANSSHIGEVRAAWNPAFTAIGNDVVADGFFRMQWLGFNGAPASGFISYQYPFVKNNISCGALLHFDKTGPVSKMGIQFNFAYKVKSILQKYDQLSLGLSANFQQYSFNSSGQIFNDADDQLILNSRVGRFFPSVGTGFFYISNTREFKDNTFFVGLAVNQLYTTKVLINDFDQVRQKHIHFNIGGRITNYDTYVEPMITVNLVKPDIIDVLYSLRFEKENTFWAGAGYASSGMMAIQGGIILDEFGNRYSKLRIGILANYGLGSSLAKTGPGFEFYIGYNFKTR